MFARKGGWIVGAAAFATAIALLGCGGGGGSGGGGTGGAATVLAVLKADLSGASETTVVDPSAHAAGVFEVWSDGRAR
jgi:hypothetical protein